ncbi:MAG: hypothetical protein L6Q95_08555 [Planctomycetes bacterium]|nr:hypothetical protein [Planctomycetota bacterium]
MRAAAMLLALVFAASAQDELHETVWIVGEDGELMGWPDPEAPDGMGGRKLTPFRVFDAAPGACFEDMCWQAWALLVVPGRSDLASLCDPERHLKKTNQMLFDELLLMSISSDWMAKSRADPALRRAFLDVLLGWRVLGARGLKDAAPMLKDMADADSVDPITRLAAEEIAAMLDGLNAPAVDLPPLDGIPADAGVLVVIDQRRVPPWRDVWRHHRTWGIRSARQTIARVGAAVTPADMCAAQWIMDRESEGFYELARRFGNARVHRTVLALRFDPDVGADLSFARALLRCEGLFEVDRFKAGCEASGVKPGTAGEGAASAQFADVDVTVAPDRLVVSRNYPAPAAGGGIPADLAKLGCGGDDAIWIHCRKVPFADRLPVKGVEALTLRASFDGGVSVRCEARFKDAAAAAAAKGEMERWKGLDLKPVELREARPEAVARVKAFVASLAVSVEGATLTAECAAKGETPESLLEGVVDLAALYPCEEEEGGEAEAK